MATLLFCPRVVEIKRKPLTYENLFIHHNLFDIPHTKQEKKELKRGKSEWMKSMKQPLLSEPNTTLHTTNSTKPATSPKAILTSIEPKQQTTASKETSFFTSPTRELPHLTKPLQEMAGLYDSEFIRNSRTSHSSEDSQISDTLSQWHSKLDSDPVPIETTRKENSLLSHTEKKILRKKLPPKKLENKKEKKICFSKSSLTLEVTYFFKIQKERQKKKKFKKNFKFKFKFKNRNPTAKKIHTLEYDQETLISYPHTLFSKTEPKPSTIPSNLKNTYAICFRQPPSTSKSFKHLKHNFISLLTSKKKRTRLKIPKRILFITECPIKTMISKPQILVFTNSISTHTMHHNSFKRSNSQPPMISSIS
jgi:hypothetical protein